MLINFAKEANGASITIDGVLQVRTTAFVNLSPVPGIGFRVSALDYSQVFKTDGNDIQQNGVSISNLSLEDMIASLADNVFVSNLITV